MQESYNNSSNVDTHKQLILILSECKEKMGEKSAENVTSSE